MTKKINENIMKIPESPSEISVEWLREMLINESSANKIVSIEIDKNFGPVSLLGKVVRVIINYAEEVTEPKSLIVKFQVSCSDKKRESVIYQLLGEAEVPFVPRLYGVFGKGNLVLEDLSFTHSVIDKNQDLTIKQIRNVVAILADINSRFYGDSRVPKNDISHFVNSININMEEGWDIYKNRYQEQLEEAASDFEWMWQNREIVSAYYNSGPATLIHGDVNRGNLLFSNDGSDKPILIDWQLSGQKVLPFDLAYFIIQRLTVAQRRKHENELVREYYNLLPEYIHAEYSFDHLMLDYRACVTRTMLSSVTGVGPKFSSRLDQFERADAGAARVIAAVKDLKPVEAIQELQAQGLL
jgi:hypothetical protein